ncbi:hypothetical protein STIAU_8532 [Stigmatella aurantiaca DW4/3-1]|uniref:Uncharacterized protein n=1 Tax=Stigmatella aurantiaca (strain DW4/3-1) TaxID=378806 RepID=Q09AP5_STIAD|nr:hypothetical protein STIAU_8532 [Stigmatella aurantiaca DW4/3-1]
MVPENLGCQEKLLNPLPERIQVDFVAEDGGLAVGDVFHRVEGAAGQLAHLSPELGQAVERALGGVDAHPGQVSQVTDRRLRELAARVGQILERIHARASQVLERGEDFPKPMMAVEASLASSPPLRAMLDSVWPAQSRTFAAASPGFSAMYLSVSTALPPASWSVWRVLSASARPLAPRPLMPSQAFLASSPPLASTSVSAFLAIWPTSPGCVAAQVSVSRPFSPSSTALLTADLSAPLAPAMSSAAFSFAAPFRFSQPCWSPSSVSTAFLRTASPPFLSSSPPDSIMLLMPSTAILATSPGFSAMNLSVSRPLVPSFLASSMTLPRTFLASAAISPPFSSAALNVSRAWVAMASPYLEGLRMTSARPRMKPAVVLSESPVASAALTPANLASCTAPLAPFSMPHWVSSAAPSGP